ncbi:hypothetical protein SEA_NOSHOW_24 [Mycobacterium phage NoShow]|nr:hypothetical protein SEA_NOSHOW_24 [Mycobacterium phage NoShow]
MALTNNFYGGFWLSLGNKEIDLDSDTIRAILVNGYVFNKDTHRYKNLITTGEIAAGNGYATNGVSIGPGVISWDATSDQFRFDANDPVWDPITANATGMIVFDDTPATNKPLICYVDFGQTFQPVNGRLSFAWNAIGIGYVSA